MFCQSTHTCLTTFLAHPFFPSPSSRSWLIALLHGLPFLGLTFVLVACPSSGLPLFRVCLCPFSGLALCMFWPFFPNHLNPSQLLLVTQETLHTACLALSPHCWALLCPWAWNPLSQQVRFLYPWVRFLYPWAWNPLQVRCWQS